MKASLAHFLMIFALIMTASGNAQSQQDVPSIIPKPMKAEWKKGVFRLPSEVTVCYNSGAAASADWLVKLLKSTSSEVKKTEGQNCGNFSMLINDELKEQLGEEGYKLSVNSKGVKMQAATNAGLFYAVQTLRQMFPAAIENQKLQEGISLKQVEITDKPIYAWRGSMLDIARSFFGIDYLKKHVDRMALYKMNRFHLHLSDDQGWRIELKNKPKLTAIGGKSSVKNGRSGYLTQEEYKELQEYAAARNIVIIPEIDMPGHTYAALLSYPELNCDNYANLDPQRALPPAHYQEYRVGWSRLCTERADTYDFVSEVISELAKMTKGPWLHIGGDEIDDEHYKEFVIKADSIVRENGKTAIGWEEVTQAPVDSSFISQRWNGRTKSVVNTRIIESICSSFYFDHANVPGQPHTNNWCNKEGVSLKDAYNFETDDQNVIGVESAVWSEFVVSDDMADNRLWPRNIAVSEIGWTPSEKRDFDDFTGRLGRQGARLDNL
ncbi:MAG: beta-N-acetylhexosaminidase, partial [Salegentibacter sp.]